MHSSVMLHTTEDGSETAVLAFHMNDWLVSHKKKGTPFQRKRTETVAPFETAHRGFSMKHSCVMHTIFSL